MHPDDDDAFALVYRRTRRRTGLSWLSFTLVLLALCADAATLTHDRARHLTNVLASAMAGLRYRLVGPDLLLHPAHQGRCAVVGGAGGPVPALTLAFQVGHHRVGLP